MRWWCVAAATIGLALGVGNEAVAISPDLSDPEERDVLFQWENSGFGPPELVDGRWQGGPAETDRVWEGGDTFFPDVDAHAYRARLGRVDGEPVITIPSEVIQGASIWGPSPRSTAPSRTTSFASVRRFRAASAR